MEYRSQTQIGIVDGSTDEPTVSPTVNNPSSSPSNGGIKLVFGILSGYIAALLQ